MTLENIRGIVLHVIIDHLIDTSILGRGEDNVDHEGGCHYETSHYYELKGRSIIIDVPCFMKKEAESPCHEAREYHSDKVEESQGGWHLLSLFVARYPDPNHLNVGPHKDLIHLNNDASAEYYPESRVVYPIKPIRIVEGAGQDGS